MGGVRTRLRRDTAALHRQADHDLGFLLRPDLTLDRYRRLLAALHGFHAPLEAAIERAATGLELMLRPRSRRLVDDLHALGLEREELVGLPVCAELPRIDAPDEAAGVIYVIEGASLGGQIIARAVASTLGLSPTCGASFFAGEGAGTLARWQSVVAWLDAVVARGLCERRIVEGARATFSSLSLWLRGRGVVS